MPQHRARPLGNDRPHPKTPSSGKHPRRRFLGLAAGAAALPTVSRFAWSQTYPSRPVRLIVPFGSAGATDITARLVGQWLSERLGQQFIIENRPGAGGNIGTEAVVRSPPDGHTLIMAGNYNAWNPALYDKLSFNFLRDIAPVASIIRFPSIMVINPSVPAKTPDVPNFRISSWRLCETCHFKFHILNAVSDMTTALWERNLFIIQCLVHDEQHRSQRSMRIREPRYANRNIWINRADLTL
jgi:hypothetical protein